MTSWDAFVDRLWAGAPDVGATLLAANFHRTFIDLNRDERDIDPSMLDQAWAGAQPTEEYSALGKGLIRRLAWPGVPMYDRLLTVAEVQARIDGYYRPYHTVLAEALDAALARFGSVWHINCHSMQSVGNALHTDNGQSRPDLVISDRDGASADPAFTQWVADAWRALGYQVAINEPYKGGDIVKRYGQPARNRHSIQIEINKRLYMNEQTFEPHEGVDKLERDARTFLARLRSHINGLLAGLRPNTADGAR